MKKLLYILLFTIPYHLRAQEFKPGLIKKDLRQFYHSEPDQFKVVFETDTLDSYLFQGIECINIFYKNDTCYKMQQITPFDHNEIKNIVKDSYYKKTGKDTWVYSDGTVQIKLTFDRSKDLSTMEATLVQNKSSN
jgi:hypothetical protein